MEEEENKDDKINLLMLKNKELKEEIKELKNKVDKLNEFSREEILDIE